MSRALLGAGLVGVGVVVIAASATQARPVSRRMRRAFRWSELVASATARKLGLDNTPSPQARAALRLLVWNVLGPLRALVGQGLQITSGFRSPAVNEAVTGSASSQHMRGEAVDFIVHGVASIDIVSLILQSRLPFDQLIWYAPERGGHVHVSFTARRENRRELLYAPASGGAISVTVQGGAHTNNRKLVT